MNVKNFVHLTGNIVNDAEQRIFENGRALLSFSLAENNSYKTKEGELVEEVYYHECKNFCSSKDVADKLAPILSKGSKVSVAGRLEYESWEDADGKPRKKAVIRVESFDNHTPKKS